MRLPFYMQKTGLRNVDVRMNDRVNFTHPDLKDYKKIVEDFMISNELDKNIEKKEEENTIDFFMNHGMERAEAEQCCHRKVMKGEYFRKHQEGISYLQLHGFLISYGWK